MTKSHDYTVRSGDSIALNITVYDENNDILDLTGRTVYWVLSDDPTEEPFTTKSSDEPELVIEDATSGEITVHLSSAETADLEYEYYHETIVTEGDDTSGVQEGWLFVRPSGSSSVI